MLKNFKKIALSVLGVAVLTVGFVGCSSDDSGSLNSEEDGVKLTTMSSNSQDDETKTMEISTVEFNSKNRYFFDAMNNIYIDKTELILDEAIVVNNSWSPYSLIAIPYKSNPNKFYSFYGNHSLSAPFIVEGTVEKVKITNTEGRLIGEITDGKDKIFQDSGFLDVILDNTQPIANSVCDCHGVDSCENHQYDRMENCGAYDFEECMICAEDVCDQDIKCRYGRTWTGPLYVVSVVVHCAI